MCCGGGCAFFHAALHLDVLILVVQRREGIVIQKDGCGRAEMKTDQREGFAYEMEGQKLGGRIGGGGWEEEMKNKREG